MYNWCLEGQRTAPKANVPFLVVINKKNKADLVYLECKLAKDQYG